MSGIGGALTLSQGFAAILGRMKGNTMYANDYGQPARLADLVRFRPTDADVRADWTGETANAKFQGAAQADRHAVLGVSFGKKRRWF